MKRYSKITFLMVLLCCTAFARYGGRGRLGLGYDEGLAARYFFADNVGGQVSVGMERLGGYDQTPNNGGALNPEYNISLGVGVLFNLFVSEHVVLAAMGQFAVAHDGTRSDNDVGDRNWGFLRAALAPELMLGEHLGLGMRFGVEVAVKSESKEDRGGLIVETDDGLTNVRFFGPQNPFEGSTLGMSVFVYF